MRIWRTVRRKPPNAVIERHESAVQEANAARQSFDVRLAEVSAQ